MADNPICSVEGCDKRVIAKNLCQGHYKRLSRYGSPIGGKRGEKPSKAAKGEALKWLNDNVRFDADRCLKWPYGDRGNGYGALADECGRLIGAHVLMCIKAHGPSDGFRKIVAHSCNKGDEGCVNPRHLRWATAKENSEDRIAHGTSVFGEKSAVAKLSEAQALVILQSKGLVTQKYLSEKYNVSQACISEIQRGKKWAHIKNAD